MTGTELLTAFAIVGFLTCAVVALFLLSQPLARPRTRAQVNIGFIAAALSIPFAVAAFVLVAMLLAA